MLSTRVTEKIITKLYVDKIRDRTSILINNGEILGRESSYFKSGKRQ